MIKGHVQIELHNHKTGLRERIEQDNLVTNAIPLITNALAGRGKNMNLLMPLATNAYGGVMIFEDPLTESANNVCIPGDTLLTAYAGQTLNTADPLMGSINQSESGPTEDGGYEHVWEFNTSQANGLVSSLSLTNANIVNYPLPHFSILTDLGDLNGNVYKADDHLGPNEAFRYGNNLYYSIKPGYEEQQTDKYELRYPTNDYLLTEGVSTTYTPELIRHINNTQDPDEDYYRLRYECYNGLDGYIYHIPFVQSGNNINIYRAPVEPSDDQYVWSNKIIESVMSYQTYTNSLYPYNTSVVSNGYFIRGVGIEKEDPYIPLSVHKFSCVIDDYNTTDSNTYEISLPTDYWPPNTSFDNKQITYVGALKGGGALVVCQRGGASSNDRAFFQITKNGDIKLYRTGYTQGMSGYPLLWNDDCTIVRFNAYRTLSIPGCYLGTIANLEHPFEKTNTVSMKVKYKLTQLDPNS